MIHFVFSCKYQNFSWSWQIKRKGKHISFFIKRWLQTWVLYFFCINYRGTTSLGFSLDRAWYASASPFLPLKIKQALVFSSKFVSQIWSEFYVWQNKSKRIAARLQARKTRVRPNFVSTYAGRGVINFYIPEKLKYKTQLSHRSTRQPQPISHVPLSWFVKVRINTHEKVAFS